MESFYRIERRCISLMLHRSCASSTLAWSSLSVVKTTFVWVFGYLSNIDNEKVLSWACRRRNWQDRSKEGKEKCFTGLVVELVEQRCSFLKVGGSLPTVDRVFCCPCVGSSLWLGLVIWLLENVPFPLSFFLTHPEQLYLQGHCYSVCRLWLIGWHFTFYRTLPCLFFLIHYVRTVSTTIQDICLYRQEIVNMITTQFTQKERSHSSKCHEDTNRTRPALLRAPSSFHRISRFSRQRKSRVIHSTTGNSWDSSGRTVTCPQTSIDRIKRFPSQFSEWKGIFTAFLKSEAQPWTAKRHECIQMLGAYFKSKRNVVYGCSWNLEVSVDGFVNQLRKTASEYQFWSLTEDLIRDRLVISLKDHSTSLRLLREESLDLNKVLNFCCSNKVSSQQLKAMNLDDKTTAEDFRAVKIITPLTSDTKRSTRSSGELSVFHLWKQTETQTRKLLGLC